MPLPFTWPLKAVGLDKVIQVLLVAKPQVQLAWVSTEIVPEPPLGGTMIEVGVTV
jgi:hypothetical protein